MPQYDSIGAKYDVVDGLPFKILEARNAEAVLRPLLPSSDRILEFACGSGYYTERLVSWGAKKMTCVDISSEMLNLARLRLKDQVASDQVRFVQADGSKVQSFAPDQSMAYHDTVFAGWLLNYAKTAEELELMFRNIAANLRSGGCFVGVVYPHTDAAGLLHRQALYGKPPMDRIPPRNEWVEPVPEQGWKLRIHFNADTVFDSWHLQGSIYDEAMRAAGFDVANATWRQEPVENEWKDELNLTEEEWIIWKACPQCVILKVQKL